MPTGGMPHDDRRPAHHGGPGRTRATASRWMFADTLTITWRNLIALTRIPEALFFSTLQPIMFVLLFRYVFGGAIHIPDLSYVDYLMPGIFVQTVAFGAVSTAVGLAEDLQKGLIERFRALPMARSAVLAGRTTADLARNVFVVALMTGVGYAVGFRIGTNVGLFLCGALLLLAFSYALGWGFAIIGLSASNSETAQVMAFPILFPFTFASSAFVPVSIDARLAAGLRQEPTGQRGGERRPARSWWAARSTTANSVWISLAWIVGLLVVLAPSRAQVPPSRLTRHYPRRSARATPHRLSAHSRYSSPARRCATSPSGAAARPPGRRSGTRTCSVVSRSRTVTASSSSESKSTVTHHGVPTSSWRR